MQEAIAILDDRLAHAGDVLPFVGHMDLNAYELGEHEFFVPMGFDYDLILTNAGEGILASGMVRGHVEATCDRCLEKAEFDLAAEVDEYFLFKAPSQTHSLGDDEDDADFSLVGDDHTIDLTEALHAAVLMDTPFVVLCREDCKGLCPICGKNLNLGQCHHEEEE